MRRVALLLVLGLILVATAGCQMNWADPLHPTPCPVIHYCDRPGMVYQGPVYGTPAPAPYYTGCTTCPCSTYP